MPVESPVHKSKAGGTAAEDGLGSFLIESEPLYASLLRQIKEIIHPVKLPPLQLTSAPAEVKDIWGDYAINKKVSAPASLLIHGVLLALILIPFGGKVVEVVKQEVFTPVDISPYLADLPADTQKAGGGGGGGDRSPEPPSKGELPELAMEQLTSPAVVIRNPEPKLPAVPTVIVPPQITLPTTINLAQLGDPMGQIGVPSSGPGFGGGIGTGSGGGVGSGKGPGVGPGEGGGIGGGVFRVGGGVSAPQIVFKVDPEYSEQARKAKYQGTVVLNLVVQKDGTVRDIRVVRALGLGLDEKAVEAVQQWRFRPGQKSGDPVDVAATVEVTFRLL